VVDVDEVVRDGGGCRNRVYDGMVGYGGFFDS